MRHELDFNDPDIIEHRSWRLSRLGTRDASPAEHTYLHATLDEAVRDLQGGCMLPIVILWLSVLSVVVLLLALR